MASKQLQKNRPKIAPDSGLDLTKISKNLVAWFKADQRDLPWRKSKDPYAVWISEIMLQQTTTQAVRGYFDRFLGKWPTVEALAKAKQEEVNEYWAGLGYYSRARNILKTAQIIANDYDNIFPRTADELIKLPGIGPYTSRAISSICFKEKVGVVDGNVLRVHNRLLGLKINWWEKDFHKSTQIFSDSLCQLQKPNIINPALMDLGSTVCTPKKVMCSICPLTKNCQTFKNHLQDKLPLSKPRKEKEFWSYTVFKNNLGKKHVYTADATEIKAPVLKKNILPLGRFKQLEKKPKTYAFMHTITHHNIFIKFAPLPQTTTLQTKGPTGPKPKSLKKTSKKQLKQATPSSLIEKIWQEPNFYESI